MTTYALYRTEEDGSYQRIGTFTAKKGNSVRIVSAQLKEKMPNLDLSRHSIKVRKRLFDEVVDFGDFVPLDPNC